MQQIKSSALYLQKNNQNGNNQKKNRALLDIIYSFCSVIFLGVVFAIRFMGFNGAAF